MILKKSENEVMKKCFLSYTQKKNLIFMIGRCTLRWAFFQTFKIFDIPNHTFRYKIK